MTFISNGKSARSNSNERSVYDTSIYSLDQSIHNQFKSLLEPVIQPVRIVVNGNSKSNDKHLGLSLKEIFAGSSRRPERYSPNEVASFIRGIDPSFDTLAARFLQEVFKNKSL